MKAFVVLILFVSYVSARGSGPYLPSGWKPEGPAFYLPSEIGKAGLSLNQEPLFEETEASGSDALREYGPPNLEVSVNVNQGLPDVVTEQSFIDEIKKEEVAVAVEEEEKSEVNTEQVTATVEEVSTVTESESTEKVQTVVEETTELIDVQPTVEVVALEVSQEEKISTPALSEDVKTEAVVPTAIIVEEAIIPTAALEELVIEDVKLQEVVPTTIEGIVSEGVDVGVNNIADALINLENEVKTVEAIENNAKISSTQEVSGFLDQVPEGFLEYGPPGFAEYGPPKEDLIVEVVSNALGSNDVRRRRFSPKFKSSKKQ